MKWNNPETVLIVVGLALGFLTIATDIAGF